MEFKDFNIGDLVERIKDSHGNYKVGDKGKIIARTPGESFQLENDKDGYGHNFINLKLIKAKELIYEIY